MVNPVTNVVRAVARGFRCIAPAACAAALMASPPTASAAENMCAAYFRRSFVQWGFSPEMVRYDKITHLFYFWPAMAANGTIDASSTDPILLDLRDRCRQADVKIIGVIYSPTANFTTALANAGSRNTAVQAIAKWCREARLDGIDIDYEHPRNATDAANLAQFLTELRAALGDRPLLCAAVAPVLGTSSVPAAVVNEDLDWLNIMSYDHGGQHATWNSSISDMDFHSGQGILPSKLVLGIPFYGTHPTNRDSTVYSNLINRASAQPFDPGVNTIDGYFFNGRTLVRDKGKLGFLKGGGVFTWVIDQDTTDARSLLTAMEDGAVQGQATLDGFEAPLFGNPGDGATVQRMTLAPTLRRSAGTYGARATLQFDGSPWCDVDMTSPVIAPFSLQADGAVRFDAYLEGDAPGAVYFYLTDNQGRTASIYNSVALNGTGWKSVWLPRSGFNLPAAGFDFENIVRWRLLIQGGNGGTAVAPFTRTLVLDNLALYSPGTKRPQRLDLDADLDGVPDRNIASRAVVWIDRFNHTAPTVPAAIYTPAGNAPATWKWAASAHGGGYGTLEGSLAYDGSRWQISWLESPVLPPFATAPQSVFHSEIDVIEAMPNATLYIDFFDDTGARRRFWDYNILKSTGRKMIELTLGSPNEGTNDLSRLTNWRIGFEGTGTNVAPFNGKVQFANFAWGRLPAGSTAASYVGDLDGDGLSDIAEDRNLNGILEPGESDPELPDTDGDGTTDGDEALAGTDPRDSASRFALGMARNGGNTELTWPVVPGRMYQIQASPDMRVWTIVRPWFTPAGAAEVWTTPSSAPSRFFRLQVK